jgi:hypothetical protein
MKLLKHITTDYDNKTYDTGRVLALGYFVSATLFEVWNMIKGRPFSVSEYLAGGGAYLGGLGIYIFGDGKGKEANKNAILGADGS